MPKRILLIIILSLMCIPVFAEDGAQKSGISFYGSAVSTSDRTKVLNSHMRVTVVSGGVSREALVYLPHNYNPKTPMPLILCFHGLGMKAFQMPLMTRMDQAADRHGFIVAYPDAVDHRWDDGYTGNDRGDFAFVKDLLDALPRQVTFNRNRVYSCGISDGGFFSLRLSCAMPKSIKAIAIVAATGFDVVCSKCSGPVMPVMYFLGTADPLMPYDDSHNYIAGLVAKAAGVKDAAKLAGTFNEIGGMYNAQQAIAYWIKRNGITTKPKTYSMPHRASDPCSVIFYDYGTGRNEIAAYVVQNGGHTWPGGDSSVMQTHEALGNTGQDIDASELMCRFFASK